MSDLERIRLEQREAALCCRSWSHFGSLIEDAIAAAEGREGTK